MHLSVCSIVIYVLKLKKKNGKTKQKQTKKKPMQRGGYINAASLAIAVTLSGKNY